MNNLDMKLEDLFLEDLFIGFLTDADVLQVEEKDGTIKHFELRDDKWELYALQDENGVHELTSIPNFSNYKADLQRGKIYSLVSDKFLSKGKPNYYGYCYSTLRNDNGVATPVSLHSVIMSAALQQEPQKWIDEGLEIDHKNGVKHQNNISNLRLVTRKQQYDSRVRQKMSDNAGTPLTKDEVMYIRYLAAMLEAKGEKVDSIVIHMIAKRFEKQYETIRKVINGVTHKEIGLTPEMKAQVVQAKLERDLEQIKELVNN